MKSHRSVPLREDFHETCGKFLRNKRRYAIIRSLTLGKDLAGRFSSQLIRACSRFINSDPENSRRFILVNVVDVGARGFFLAFR